MEIVVWVCEKCGFRTKPFDLDDTEQYFKAKKEMEEHVREKHPKSPRYHNYTHFEWIK